MNNFEKFKRLIDDYFLKNNSNKEKVSYVYNGIKDIDVIDMDEIARCGYKKIKNPETDPINTVDAFLINRKNEWFLIEFKDSTINASNNGLKNSVIKKAYSNWCMILDMLYEMKNTKSEYAEFDFDNPMKFARENVTYILVCSLEKNSKMYIQIKNSELVKSKYTPPFMCRLKNYLFKDAYVFTEDYLERKIVNNFEY